MEFPTITASTVWVTCSGITEVEIFVREWLRKAECDLLLITDSIKYLNINHPSNLTQTQEKLKEQAKIQKHEEMLVKNAGEMKIAAAKEAATLASMSQVMSRVFSPSVWERKKQEHKERLERERARKRELAEVSHVTGVPVCAFSNSANLTSTREVDERLLTIYVINGRISWPRHTSSFILHRLFIQSD